MDILADKLERLIAEQDPREQSGFHENLESVADAKHDSAVVRKAYDVFHDGRESREGTAPKIVAIRKATREDHDIDVAER